MTKNKTRKSKLSSKVVKTHKARNKKVYNFNIKVLLTLLVIVVAVVFLAKLYKSKNYSRDDMKYLNKKNVTTNTVVLNDFSVGDEITVTKVTLVEPGFVYIHKEDNMNPGEVIAKSDLMQPGVYKNIKLKLSEPTIAGQFIYAILHKQSEEIFVDDQGNQILMGVVVGSMDHGMDYYSGKNGHMNEDKMLMP